MATHYYVVLTRAVPGQEETFHRWYDDRHLADCLDLPEVRSARRFRLLTGIDGRCDPQPAPFDSLVLYELESDDPLAIARALSARAGSEAMPLTDAFDRSATVRAMAVAAGSLGRLDRDSERS